MMSGDPRDMEKFAVLVGDRYHSAGPMLKALEGAAGGITNEMEAFTDPTKLAWDSLERYRALIVAREARVSPEQSGEVWIDERHGRAIARFVETGGALIVVHAGLASYGHDSPYGRVIHGSFLFHPQEHPLFHLSAFGLSAEMVEATGTSHPILEGFKGFDLKDEMYFVRVDSSLTVPLLTASHPDYGSSTAAWAHTAGLGRVFCFTCGHTEGTLGRPEYGQFLKCGVHWAVS